jgi:hypothetical protein
LLRFSRDSERQFSNPQRLGAVVEIAIETMNGGTARLSEKAGVIPLGIVEALAQSAEQLKWELVEVHSELRRPFDGWFQTMRETEQKRLLGALNRTLICWQCRQFNDTSDVESTLT